MAVKKSRRKTGKPPLLIVAGEHSGDLLGGETILALKKLGYDSFLGTGGDAMKAAGAELLETVESMTIIGFVEALKAYPRLKKLALRLADAAQERGVTSAILIDYPGFNLRLAAMLKERGIRVVYLVSPQIWAWHYSRINKIRQYVDLMLTLFPFEKEMYDAEGVESFCIGHPMVFRIPRELRKSKALRFKNKKPIIGLLPGSRGSEISRLLPPMLEAARLLHEDFPKALFLIPGVNPRYENFIREKIAAYPDLPLEYLEGESLRIMATSDVLLLASGTASLEAAFFKKPMVIAYRVGLFNYFIASLVARTRFVGLPNLLAREQVARELLMDEANGENMAQEVARLLNDSGYRGKILRELTFVRKQIGSGNPAARAARRIHRFIQESSQPKNPRKKKSVSRKKP